MKRIIDWIKRNALILMILCFMIVQTYVNVLFVLKFMQLQKDVLYLKDMIDFIMIFLGIGTYKV